MPDLPLYTSFLIFLMETRKDVKRTPYLLLLFVLLPWGDEPGQVVTEKLAGALINKEIPANLLLLNLFLML